MNQARDTPPSARERFGSRVGFVLPAVGSAVGLGNMWRFPSAHSESWVRWRRNAPPLPAYVSWIALRQTIRVIAG